MSTWKYKRNDETCGPIESSALQTLLNNGTLAADTLVQKEGAADWVLARTQPELVSSAVSAGHSSSSGTPEPEPADAERNKVFALLA